MSDLLPLEQFELSPEAVRSRFAWARRQGNPTGCGPIHRWGHGNARFAKSNSRPSKSLRTAVQASR